MADAEFIFSTNISKVASEIEAGLRQINDASAAPTATQGNTFLDDLAAKARRQVEGAIKELRRLNKEYSELGRGGGSLAGGQATFSASAQKVLRQAAEGINATIGKTSLKAPAELGSLDLAKLSADYNRLVGDTLSKGIRKRISEFQAEFGKESGSIFGSSASIRSDKARSGLTDLGSPDAQREIVAAQKDAAAAERQAARAAQRLAAAAEREAATAEAAAAGGGRRPPTPPPTAPAPPPEDPRRSTQLPSVADLRRSAVDDERRLAGELLGKLGQPGSGVNFLRTTPGGSSSRIFDASDPGNVKFFQRTDSGGVKQLDPLKDQVDFKRAQEDYAARLQRAGVVQEKAGEDNAARIQQAGILYARALREDATRTQRASQTAERTQSLIDRSELALQKARLALADKSGHTGVPANFLAGFTSTGFGGEGSTNGSFDGLAKSAGISAKYALIGQALFTLQNAAAQAVKELLDANDSITELEVAMGDGAQVTGGFTSKLQDFAAVGGFNVGEAMDQAASGIRAFKDEVVGTSETVDQLGVDFSKQAARIAVISKTDLGDAAGNLKAITSGFDLSKNDVGFSRVADAIAGAKLTGGGDEKQIGQGLANSALIFKEMGFTVEEAAATISKIVAETDQSGQVVATRLSRISSILGGSSGKKFIGDLNAQLKPNQQIDVNASLRDQVLQLSKAYGTLSEAQRQQVNSALGGTANQRELIILLQELNKIVVQTDKGFQGKAAEEYAKRLENLRAVLTTIQGETKAITVNLATSGAFDPLFVAVEGLKEALIVVQQLTSAFDALPKSVRSVGFALVEVLAVMKGIGAIRSAGGIRGFIGTAERSISPQRAAAAQTLVEGINNRVERIQTESGGVPNARQQAQLNALETERVNLERRYNLGIETAAAQRAIAEQAQNAAIARGGLGGLLASSANAQRGLITGAGAGIAARSAAARDALLGQLERTPATLGGFTRFAGRGIAAGAGAVGRGVGALAAGIGPIGGALIATDLGLQLKGAAEDIHHARDLAADELKKPIELNVSAMRDSAQSLKTAASNIDQATSGFFGGIANAIGGGGASRQSEDLKTIAGLQEQAANRVASILSGERSGKTGIAGVASTIDFTSGQSVSDSLKALEDQGQSATVRLQALTLAIRNLDFATGGSTRNLTAAQRGELGASVGPDAAKAFAALRERANKAAADSILTGAKRFSTGNDTVDRVLTLGIPNDVGQTGRRKSVDALDKVNVGRVNDVTKQVVDQQLASGANLSSDAGQAGLRRLLAAQYEAVSIDPKRADQLAEQVAKEVKDRTTHLLSSVNAFSALSTAVQQGISAAKTGSQDNALQAQISALRAGDSGNTDLAAAQANRQALKQLRSVTEQKVREAVAAGTIDQASANLSLTPLIQAQNQAEIDYLQALRKQAEEDISNLEQQRQSQQNRAKGAAQVKAIGERFLKLEVSKALVSRDTDALIKILDNANTQEVATIKAALEAVISVEQQAIAGAQRALEAASAFGGGAGGVGYTGGEAIAQYRKATQDKLQEDLNQLSVLKKGIAQSHPDTSGKGVYATGSDVLNKSSAKTGDTAAQIAAARQSAAAVLSNNGIAEARAALAVAQADLGAAKKNTVAYYGALSKVYEAQKALADLIRSAAAAAGAATAARSGGAVEEAVAGVKTAIANLVAAKKGTAEFYSAQSAYYQAQKQLVDAQTDAQNLRRRLTVDLTDPVATAQADLRDAQAKLNALQRWKRSPDLINQAQLDVKTAQNNAEAAAFSQRLGDVQTAEQLGRISHQAYLQYLQNEHNRLNAIKNKTRQQQDELNQIDLAIKSAADELSGQFNIGDIKVPTPYEARRFIATQAAGVSYTGGANVTQNTLNINGTDTGMVVKVVTDLIGPSATTTRVTSSRKVTA